MEWLERQDGVRRRAEVAYESRRSIDVLSFGDGALGLVQRAIARACRTVNAE